MRLQQIRSLALEHHLDVFGAFHPDKDDYSRAASLVLLGPVGRFWEHLQASPEYRDNEPNPVDRWSTRIITGMAQELGGTPHLPFGGPPYAPFLDWALKSGRAWTSEVGMLIHDRTGLLVSYRGAIGFSQVIDFGAQNAQRPCDTCIEKPCITACPVGALTPAGYDVPACKSYLSSEAGTECLNRGCAVRRICPISHGAERASAQSAHHMRAFKGA